MSRFQGSVDFSLLAAIPSDALCVETNGEMRHARLPGLDVKWVPHLATMAFGDGVLAVATASKRSQLDKRDDASQWVARYFRDDVRAAESVSGEFAVAIIDFRKRQVLLAVDRFAVQTLCYRAHAGQIGFADAASAVPNSSKMVEAQSLYDYLYFHVIPSPHTVFSDVRRVEPAHCVVASAVGAETARYWEPAFCENNRRDFSGRLREFVTLVQGAVLDEAEETATACFLSGGTDSSTVAGMLTRARGEPVHAYSIGFDAQGYDEMEYARIAARHFDLVHHEYYLTPDDLVRAIPDVAASFDQPFGNSSILPAYYCALRAKEDGFTRMLAGDGGDELFAGNSRYALQKTLQLYHALPPGLRKTVLEPAAIDWAVFQRMPGLKQLGGYVRHSHVPMPDRFENFNMLRRLDAETMFEADFRASIDPWRPIERQRLTWQAVTTDTLLNRMLAYDWKYTLAENDLPKVRYATSLAGISVGYPFLARPLVDFSLSLPPEWKLKRLKLRWFFKEALRDFLPDAILRKKKHGFGLPFGHWVLRHTGLRSLAANALNAIAERGIVRPRFTTELLRVRLAEAPGYYGGMVWLLVMLEHWLRSHEVKLSLVRRDVAECDPLDA